MEISVVRLSQVLEKKAWHFPLFSAEARRLNTTLKDNPYPLVRLGELVEAERGFSHVGGNWLLEGIPVISSSDIISNRVAVESINRFISLEAHEKLYKTAIQRGDVIVSLIVRSGNSAAVYMSDEPANITSHLVRLRLHAEKIDSDYLVNFLNSSVGRSIMRQRAMGSIQPSLTLSQLLDLPIPLPPLTTQKKLVQSIHEKQRGLQGESKKQTILEQRPRN